MSNPLIAWRHRHGLTRRALALAAGVAYSSMYAVEVGTATRLHPKIVELVQESDGAIAAQELIVAWETWKTDLAHRAREAVVQ